MGAEKYAVDDGREMNCLYSVYDLNCPEMSFNFCHSLKGHWAVPIKKESDLKFEIRNWVAF